MYEKLIGLLVFKMGGEEGHIDLDPEDNGLVVVEHKWGEMLKYENLYELKCEWTIRGEGA